MIKASCLLTAIYFTLQFPIFLQSQQSCSNLVDGEVYYITNQQDNHAMDVRERSLSPGAEIITWIPFVGQPNQLFSIKMISKRNNRFMIIAYDTGLAMDLSTGYALQQLPNCSSGKQIFTTIPVDFSLNSCYIRNDPDGSQLHVLGVLDEFVGEIGRTGATDQKWVFHPIPLRCGNLFDNGVYYIQSAVSGNVVDVNLDSPTPGSEVQVSSTFENRTNQLFYIKIVPSRPDTFMILNVASNLAIDVGGSATLEVPTCTGTQLFSSVLSGNDNCYIYSIPVRDYIILYNDNDILSTIILRGEGQLQNQWLFQNITPNFEWTPVVLTCLDSLKSDTEVTSCKSSGTTNGIVATVRTVLCIGIIVVIVFTTS